LLKKNRKMKEEGYHSAQLDEKYNGRRGQDNTLLNRTVAHCKYPILINRRRKKACRGSGGKGKDKAHPEKTNLQRGIEKNVAGNWEGPDRGSRKKRRIKEFIQKRRLSTRRKKMGPPKKAGGRLTFQNK